MRTTAAIIIWTFLLTLSSCRQPVERELTNFEYFDLTESDTVGEPMLFAVTNEDLLQYGAAVAYVSILGDTIIPFGIYAYYGTDTLIYYANVIEMSDDATFGRQIAIDRNQRVLFDLVMFDNGPEPFNDGLTRVLRNGKMGYANRYGRVVIPCIYDYVKWFKNGEAEVTFNATEYMDGEEHRRVESDEWFRIDRRGQKIK